MPRRPEALARGRLGVAAALGAPGGATVTTDAPADAAVVAVPSVDPSSTTRHWTGRPNTDVGARPTTSPTRGASSRAGSTNTIGPSGTGSGTRPGHRRGRRNR